MTLSYTIKDFYNEGDNKVVGFMVTDNSGNIMVIDKRIPITANANQSFYFTVAAEMCQEELTAWQESISLKGSVFIPSTGKIVSDIQENIVQQTVPSYITRRQCAIELRERGMITASEALHMTKYGDIPQMISTIISDLPENERILIETDFAADSYLRSNQLLNSLMIAAGASEADIDQFFISASTR
jgi:hypothetical protein